MQARVRRVLHAPDWNPGDVTCPESYTGMHTRLCTLGELYVPVCIGDMMEATDGLHIRTSTTRQHIETTAWARKRRVHSTTKHRAHALLLNAPLL